MRRYYIAYSEDDETFQPQLQEKQGNKWVVLESYDIYTDKDEAVEAVVNNSDGLVVADDIPVVEEVE